MARESPRDHDCSCQPLVVHEGAREIMHVPAGLPAPRAYLCITGCFTQRPAHVPMWGALGTHAAERMPCSRSFTPGRSCRQ